MSVHPEDVEGYVNQLHADANRIAAALERIAAALEHSLYDENAFSVRQSGAWITREDRP